jgi:hypothetical protein
MTAWPLRNPPFPPPQPYVLVCSFPCVVPVLVPIACPGFGPVQFDPGCGAFPPPFIPHPTLWDLHVYRDTVANGAPRVARLSSDVFVNGVQLPDPCDNVGFGTSSRNSPNSVELFPLN